MIRFRINVEHTGAKELAKPKVGFRPKVSQIEGFGLLSKSYNNDLQRVTCGM